MEIPSIHRTLFLWGVESGFTLMAASWLCVSPAPHPRGHPQLWSLIALCLLRRKAQLFFLSSSSSSTPKAVSFSPKPWPQRVTSQTCHEACLRSVVSVMKSKHPRRRLWRRSLPRVIGHAWVERGNAIIWEKQNTKLCLCCDHGYCWGARPRRDEDPDGWRPLEFGGCGVK